MLKVAAKTDREFTMFDIPYPNSFEKSNIAYENTVDTILGYKQFTNKAYRGMSFNATWKLPTKEAARLQNIFEHTSDTLVIESVIDSFASVPNAARDPEFILRSIFQNYMDSNTAIFKTNNGFNDRAEIIFSKGFTGLPKDRILRSPMFHSIVNKNALNFSSGLGGDIEAQNSLKIDLKISVFQDNYLITTYTYDDNFYGVVTLDNIFIDFPDADTLLLEYYYYIDINSLSASDNRVRTAIPVTTVTDQPVDTSFIDTLSTTYRPTGSTSNNYISTHGEGMSEISYTFEEVLD